MSKKNHYVNNKSLYSSLLHYKALVQDAEEQGKPIPRVSNYIGEAIVLICTRLSNKPNFYGYTYKDDMISDAIIDCVAAVDNFDPDKTNNPFAYFTQIAWFAFLRRIDKEKRQTYIKHKNFENSFLMNQLWSDSENIHLKSNDFSADIIRTFENKLTKNKNSVKIKGVEKFIESEKEQENDKE